MAKWLYALVDEMTTLRGALIGIVAGMLVATVLYCFVTGLRLLGQFAEAHDYWGIPPDLLPILVVFGLVFGFVGLMFGFCSELDIND